MKTKSILRLILTSCGLLVAALPAFAWDAAGHMLVGQVAWDQLRPEVQVKAADLVALLPNEYNEHRPYHFVTSGCWMDDMRAMPKYPWAKWHYADIPCTGDPAAFLLPQPPHVVWAIHEAMKSLADPALPADKRAEAIGMLIHFVGDVHQPLHAADRNDRGGNGVLVAGVKAATLRPGKPATLHFFWDAAFRFEGASDGGVHERWECAEIAARPAKPGDGVVADEARKIITDYPREALPELSGPGKEAPEAWARESHEIGCTSAYPESAEASDTRLQPLSAEFVQKSRETARRRIALAGYRLAAVLNEVLREPTAEK